MSSGFGYIRELDGLRGVSILLILGVHSGPLAGGSGRTSFCSAACWPWRRWRRLPALLVEHGSFRR